MTCSTSWATASPDELWGNRNLDVSGKVKVIILNLEGMSSHWSGHKETSYGGGRNLEWGNSSFSSCFSSHDTKCFCNKVVYFLCVNLPERPFLHEKAWSHKISITSMTPDTAPIFSWTQLGSLMAASAGWRKKIQIRGQECHFLQACGFKAQTMKRNIPTRYIHLLSLAIFDTK